MRVLVCPQEFKGSLTAAEAARAIAAGVRQALPDAEVIEHPMADGGPGTVEIVCQARGGTLLSTPVRDPFGEMVSATYALIPRGGSAGPLAVIEASAAAGLLLVPPERRDPARASTFGVGELLHAALTAGATEVIVGVGGTGTNDGGAGAARALGFLLLDARGVRLAPGALALLDLDRIDPREAEPLLRSARIRVASDVRNVLLGAEGATAIYGPQKGVTPQLQPLLERALTNWARVIQRDLRVSLSDVRGGGAGGGLAAGLVAIAGAHIESGAAVVDEATGLAVAIAAADLVVTGEGRLDAQTAYGKTVAHVARVAAAAGRRCVAVAGCIEAVPADVADAEAAAGSGVDRNEAMNRAATLVRAAAGRLARRNA